MRAGQWAALLLTVAATGMAAQPAARGRDLRSEAEIRSLFEAFNRAWERRDAAFIERFYAHDADELFFFERRQLTGWDSIRTLYGAMFANAARGRVESTFDNLQVRAFGDMAWLAVNFRLTVTEPGGATSVDAGRETMVFERRAGRWVVVHRHTSFQAPPGPQRAVPIATHAGPLWSPPAGAVAPDDERLVRAARARSNAAIAAHDVAGITREMSPEVMVLSSVSQVALGVGQNAERFAQQFRDRPDVIYVREPDSVRVFAPWGMATEWGQWRGRWTQPGGVIEIGGPYFAKWHRAGAAAGGGPAWLVVGETYVPGWCRGGVFCERRP